MKFTLALSTMIGFSNAVKLESKQYGWDNWENDNWLAQSKTQDDDEWSNEHHDWFGGYNWNDDEIYVDEWHGEDHHGEDWHGDDYYGEDRHRDDHYSEWHGDEEWSYVHHDSFGDYNWDS